MSMIIKCGKCKAITEAEEIITYVYYRCNKCKSINEVCNVPLKSWLGFNYLTYKQNIDKFLNQYDFDDVMAKNNIEIEAGKLTSQQIERLRRSLSKGFNNELNLKQIAEDIRKNVNPKDLYRMKDGNIVRRDGIPVLALSKESRPIMIARTETTRAGAEGSILHYKDGGVRELRFVASLGKRTCNLCMGYNGQIFSVEEAQGFIPSKTHPYCRCAFIAIESMRENISPIQNFRMYKNG